MGRASMQHLGTSTRKHKGRGGLGVGPVGLLLACLLLPAGSAGAGDEDFPRPDTIAPQIAFWTRIYSEIGTDAGLLHDARHLDVVYEVIEVPRDLPKRVRERRIDRARKRYREALLSLARSRSGELDPLERRVLALWPEGVSSRTLREAAKRIRFQRGQADRFREGIIRSGRYLPHIRQVLAEEGVPDELFALPHVESSYDPHAHSHAGAAGLWQFTRGTGRLFLRIDEAVDERLDPFAATHAAARLLRRNHDRLGTWPLAITAYNHGALGVERAVKRLGTRDIGVIVERYDGRAFGFASRNFYAEFLAALDVARDAERHFGPLSLEAAAELEAVPVSDFVPADALARALGVDLGLLRAHNPALRPRVWRGEKRIPPGTVLRLPVGSVPGTLAAAVASLPDSARFDRQIPDRIYRVRRGDTLSRIARRTGIPVARIMAANGIRNRHRIRAGQKLVLPGIPAARAHAGTPAPGRPGSDRYRVRPGDTLSSIASRHGLRPSDLARANGLRNPHHIRAGDVLRIPVAGGARSYRVRRGDTLSAIAKRFGVSAEAIARTNRLRSRHWLRVGQVLRIPDAG